MKRVLSFVLIIAIFAGLTPSVLPQASAAEDSGETLVALPADGVVAEVRYYEDDEVKTRQYTLEGTSAARSKINEQLTKAWRSALDYSRESSKRIPEDKVTAYQSCGARAELHIYIDWLAVGGKFNHDGDDDGFDGGELEIDGWDDAKLLLDLHGHTLDRGSTSTQKYGRILDIYNNGSVFALVSTGAMGTVTGGWDDEGGAIRSDDDCMLFFSNIHFTGNRAEKGGALYTLDEGITYVDNCKFSGNIAEECGGAIATAEVGGEKNYTDWFYLTDSEFCGNISYGNGGAIYICDIRGDFSISGTKIYGNTAKSDGGGVYIERDARCKVHENSAIYNNHADGDGGGIFLEAYYDYNSYMYLYECEIYNNTTGASNPSPSDIHPDTGIREDAVVYICRGFSPNYAIGMVAEENGQIVLTNLNYDGDFTTMVSKCFYSARDDQFLKTVGGYVYAEKFSGAAIGDITAFDCSIGSPNTLNGIKPSHIEINNDARTINLIFPASDAAASTLAIYLNAQCTASKGSHADFDCNGYDPDGESSITLKNDTSNSGAYRGSFLLWNSDEVFSAPWVVTAEFKDDYDATLAMRVSCGSDTHPYYATDEDAFEDGWNKAVELLKEGKDVTVTLYRDWTAQDGSFGSGGGFSDGRISLNSGKTNTLTLDLNSCSIDRGLTEQQESGQVFRLSEKSRLKITDSSAQGGGKITGGYNTGEGGGFYIVDSAVLTLENVTVSGNRAKSGGGIDLNDDSRLNIQTGAVISENSCNNTDTYNDGGGGICARDDSSVWLYAGRISNNTAAPKGGGIYWCSDGKLYLLGGEITGNYSSSIDPNNYGGGGVMVDNYFATLFSYNGSDPYVGGTVRITDNHAGPNKVPSNITLDTQEENLNHYTTLPLASGAMIGVTANYIFGDDNKDCISASGSNFYADSSRYFFSDNPDLMIVADDDGSGSNKYQLHLVKADDEDFESSRCSITGISFGIAGERVEYNSAARSIVITANADRYLSYISACPATLTCTEGSTVSPAVNTLRDYTHPQSFVLTAPDGVTKQTWTVQAVPEGGTWNEYELKVYGGHADKYTYYPGETATVTADTRGGMAFSHWNISFADECLEVHSSSYAFEMPAGIVTAEAVFVEEISEVSITIDELVGGKSFSEIVVTAVHNVGDGSFRNFAPVWYEDNGVTAIKNTDTIASEKAYFLRLALEPEGTAVFAAAPLITVNGEVFYGEVYNGVLTVSGMIVSEQTPLAVIGITAKDTQNNALLSGSYHRYTFTKDGKLTAGEMASFVPEDFYDSDQNKFYQVVSVSVKDNTKSPAAEVADADIYTDGMQFKVTDDMSIVVTYRNLIEISEVTLANPVVIPGQAMPATLTPASEDQTKVAVSSLVWEPADSTAGYWTGYTGVVTLMPKDGYIFNSLVTINLDIDGDGTPDSYLYTTDFDGSLSASFTLYTEPDVLLSVTDPSPVTMLQGEILNLPEFVAVTTKYQSVTSAEVYWFEPDGFDVSTPGAYTFTGMLYLPEWVDGGDNDIISLSVTVKAPEQAPAAVADPTAVAAANGGMSGTDYLDSVTVSLSSATNGASIHYTTDGSEPSAASTLYTGPITLTETKTVKAIAFKDGMAGSGIFSCEYTVIPTYAVTVVGGTGSGKYKAGTEVTITANELGGKYFAGWTVNGGSTATLFESPLTVTVDTFDVTYTATYADQIGRVDIGIAAVDEGSALPTAITVSPNGVTGSISWDASGPVEKNTTYTAAIVLEADGGFADHGTVYINGSEVRSVMNDNGTVTAIYQVLLTGRDSLAGFRFNDSDITNIPYNTALADIPIPGTATITTEGGSIYSVSISWNLESCSYVQGGAGAQTFTVNGVIVLPTGIEGSNPEVSVTVSVNGILYVPPYDPPAEPEEPEESDERCDGGEGCPCHNYSDLDPEAWYHEAVDYVITKGMMQGYADGRFCPGGTTSRAMIITILWRLEGEPIVNYAMDFTDVAAGKWYTEAIRWAASVNLTGGYGDGRFGPADAVSREQLTTILYRYEQYRGGGFKGLWMFRMDYADISDVSDWAYEGMCWMSMNGIIRGKSGNILAPKAGATRAEAAVMLHRYLEAAGR